MCRRLGVGCRASSPVDLSDLFFLNSGFVIQLSAIRYAGGGREKTAHSDGFHDTERASVQNDIDPVSVLQLLRYPVQHREGR